MEGRILRIEKISPNDGSGLRTVVFLKGCPLRCKWCSTPESQSGETELFYKQAKCIHCGRCIQVCPRHALSVSADRRAVVRDREKCIGCYKCVDACLTEATGLYGKTMTVDEVMHEIRKESLFYFFSGGGVTLSGGDVLLQADFAAEILRQCKEECMHTMAELDMYGDYENVAKILPYLDAYFADIKLMDPELHKRWTGRSNETILRNIRQAAEEYPDKSLHARAPIIPGVNDTLENIRATLEFCKQLPACRELEFLPYHRLGSATYDYLGRSYDFKDLEPLDKEAVTEKLQQLDLEGLPFAVRVSGIAHAVSQNKMKGYYRK